MNIETANRLLQYRKQNKLSQEELAEKIGVSRQAVSKWERAEASPDTDNLIMLSKVYGVTLDELLNAPEEKEEPEAKEEVKTEDADTAENAPEDNNNNNKSSVSFRGGIHVNDSDGSSVDISFKDGIHVDSSDGSHVHIGKGQITVDDPADNYHKHQSFTFKDFMLIFPYPVIISIFFLIWGMSGLYGGWATSWLSFLTIPLYYTLIDSISKRNATHFAFPVLALLIFMVLGMYFGLWHPAWIVFLFIPVYYGIVAAINKALGKDDKPVNVEYKDV